MEELAFLYPQAQRWMPVQEMHLLKNKQIPRMQDFSLTDCLHCAHWINVEHICMVRDFTFLKP